MNITTSSGHTYSYWRRTGEIISGIIEEDCNEWNYRPFVSFEEMPFVDNFVIGVTEQCNLRCTYCCYSGLYSNNRSHSSKRMCEGDIDEVYSFISKFAQVRPLFLAFYGGEALMNLPVIKYAVNRGRLEFGDKVNFSISTNGVLLSEDVIDWVVKEDISIDMSIDGPKTIHDRQRVDSKGRGSYEAVHKVLSYLKQNYPDFLEKKVRLLMTLTSRRDIFEIAEKWNEDTVLKTLAPSKISGLSPNFDIGIEKADYKKAKAFYEKVLNTFLIHPDWVVLKKYIMDCIDDWKVRPIIDAGDSPILSTCMPTNNKLYIDTYGNIAVCEKIADEYRIGNIREGIDWHKANSLAFEYYEKRKDRCRDCPIVRMCYQCLTNVEYNEDQWNVLCCNDRVYTKVFFWLFCEMAERGLIDV